MNKKKYFEEVAFNFKHLFFYLFVLMFKANLKFYEIPFQQVITFIDRLSA